MSLSLYHFSPSLVTYPLAFLPSPGSGTTPNSSLRRAQHRTSNSLPRSASIATTPSRPALASTLHAPLTGRESYRPLRRAPLPSKAPYPPSRTWTSSTSILGWCSRSPSSSSTLSIGASTYSKARRWWLWLQFEIFPYFPSPYFPKPISQPFKWRLPPTLPIHSFFPLSLSHYQHPVHNLYFYTLFFLFFILILS